MQIIDARTSMQLARERQAQLRRDYTEARPAARSPRPAAVRPARPRAVRRPRVA